MLILLPPSEKKKAATGQHKFELTDLAFAAELLAARTSALVNQETFPTAEALEIYEGVLYQGLNWKDFSEADRKRANSRVLIISALFGLVRPKDQIFRYKLKIDNSLAHKHILISSSFENLSSNPLPFEYEIGFDSENFCST